VVNDKRESANTGAANEVEIFVRETADGLRVIDTDTGKEMPLTKGADGYRFRDTLGASWYKIYAAVKAGQTYQGPKPLAPAPAIESLTAERANAGVKLAWKVAVPDWVGCDVQWYRILRGDGGAAPKQIAEIYGRIVRGAGGLITTYADGTAAAGTKYAYQVQAVSPLRVAGPASKAVTVE